MNGDNIKHFPKLDFFYSVKCTQVYETRFKVSLDWTEDEE